MDIELNSEEMQEIRKDLENRGFSFLEYQQARDKAIKEKKAQKTRQARFMLHPDLTVRDETGTLKLADILTAIERDRECNLPEDITQAHGLCWVLQSLEHLGTILPEADRAALARVLTTDTSWTQMTEIVQELPILFAWLPIEERVETARTHILRRSHDPTWLTDVILTHRDGKQMMREIVWELITTNTDGSFAGKFLDSSDGWAASLWPCFEDVNDFRKMVTECARRAPLAFVHRWWLATAFAAHLQAGNPPPPPHNAFYNKGIKELMALARVGFDWALPMIEATTSALSQPNMTAKHVDTESLRALPIGVRYDILRALPACDSSYTIATHLLLDMHRNTWGRECEQLLGNLLRRLTPENAPYLYRHILAAEMEEGGTGYVKSVRPQKGREDEGTKTVPRESIVRQAWFYEALQSRVIECGWQFVKPTYDGFSRTKHRELYTATVVQSGQTLRYELEWPQDQIDRQLLAARTDVLVPGFPPRDTPPVARDCWRFYPLADAPCTFDTHAMRVRKLTDPND
ncbi:hypothetical protein HYW18_02955 [Candidatus Uhrbacteria bacterium]|nr:hypothetical protein [Candidatus Uhrbacteria bacterium]